MTSENRAPAGGNPANEAASAANRAAGGAAPKPARKRTTKRTTKRTNTDPTRANPQVKAGVKTARKPALRPARARTAGQRLRAEMAREGDPVGIAMLIRQASRIADRLEAIDRLLSGDADAWALVSLPRSDEKRGRLLVEVQVGDVLKEERAQSILFRHLLADIHKQRAGLRGGSGDDDDEDDDLVD